MGKETTTKRVFEILKQLNAGKTVCLEAIALQYDVSSRSIRRDIQLIKEVFGDMLVSPSRGCYQAIEYSILQDVLGSTELYLLKSILQLSHEAKLSLSKSLNTQLQKSLLHEEKDSPYFFKHKPYEEILQHKEKVKLLEHAIRYRKQIHFSYVNMSKKSHFTVNPYNIVFLNENFYLASMRQDPEREKSFLLSRIAFIGQVEYTNKTFTKNRNFSEFIHSLQTPWALYVPDFKQHLVEVVVQINKPHAKYFKLKKFLPSQSIIEESGTGCLTLSYKVTQLREIEELVKQWIPYMKIIKPQKLKETFRAIAKEYYESFD